MDRTSARSDCQSTQEAGELVVVVLPMGVERRDHPGHAWLEWTNSEGPHVPCRGYWPDYTDPDLPVECGIGTREFRRYLRTNSVRGLRKVDTQAVRFRRRHPRALVEWRAPLSADEKAQLEERCWIPPDRELVVEGRYSWNEARDDWDNCSSWALRIVWQLVDGRCPTCDRPKKLQSVVAMFGGCDANAR